MRRKSLAKKISLMTLAISIVLMIIISLSFETIFYRVMKPYLIDQVSSAVSAVALRQSYIWRNNNYLHQLSHDEQLHQLLADYIVPDSDRQAIREEIIEKLPVIINGISASQASSKPDNYGYISSVNYLLLLTDEGELFFNSSAQEAANVFRASDLYTRLQSEQKAFGHLPIIKDPEVPSVWYFVVVDHIMVDSRCFYVINMIHGQNILAQFINLEELGLDDYIIACGKEVLYAHLGEQTAVDLQTYPEMMFEGKQYEPAIWNHGDELDFMVLCTYLEEDYRIAVNVPRNILLAPYSVAFTYFKTVFCILIVVMSAFFCATLKLTLVRLTSLEKSMNQVRYGEYDVTVQDKSSDEIGSIAHTFNLMLEKIRMDMKNEEQMNYMLLVSAIDPHYICNILNTISALAELGRIPDVVKVNNALICMLRDRLRLKNYKLFDTVSTEKMAMEQYMCIQNYLCAQPISFSFDVADEDLELVIPKSIIQPLVENAIKHGILCNDSKEAEPAPGVVRVAVESTTDSIYISVTDNGAGMDEERIKRYFSEVDRQTNTHKTEHIGISNIRMRLAYLYQNRFDLQVHSVLGQGTQIVVILPRITKENEARNGWRLTSLQEHSEE